MQFEEVRRGYLNLWNKAELRSERRAQARSIAESIARDRARYEAVTVGAVPWWWVGIVHSLESGRNFRGHLHNGDTLTRRTTHIPPGRPKAGTPPFTWEESARDALELKSLQKIEAWPVERCLYEWERYNGFGYFSRGVNSPYVWSFTTLYSKGKYVADGQYDANAVSAQCGAAAILKAMVEIDQTLLETRANEVTEDDSMQKLKADIMPFAGLAPTIVGMIGGPLARIAIKAIADALGTEPDADKVHEKLETSPLQKTIDALAQAEATVQQVTPVSDPPVPAVPPVSPIDNAVGLQGWKTFLGLAIGVAATVAQNLGYLTPELFQVAMGAATLIGGAGIIAKIDRWFGGSK